MGPEGLWGEGNAPTGAYSKRLVADLGLCCPLPAEGIVYTLTHTPLLILPQNIPRTVSTHTKETDSHHSHADQGAQPPAGRPQLAQGDALGVAAPRTESVPTHGQAEISTFHLPAHFVSQDPKEVGADEVGYAGRKEGHP